LFHFEKHINSNTIVNRTESYAKVYAEKRCCFYVILQDSDNKYNKQTEQFNKKDCRRNDYEEGSIITLKIA